MQNQTRRVLLGAVASALADAPAFAQTARRNVIYERAIVIDALGGPGDTQRTDPLLQ